MLTAFIYLVIILSIVIHNQANSSLKKSYSQISKKHDQTSNNLTNVSDFIDYFSNYFAVDEIKWLCAFNKYTSKKLITKQQSTSLSCY